MVSVVAMVMTACVKKFMEFRAKKQFDYKELHDSKQLLKRVSTDHEAPQDLSTAVSLTSYSIVDLDQTEAVDDGNMDDADLKDYHEMTEV